MPDVLFDVRKGKGIGLAGERYGIALGPRPRGAADTVYIVLGLIGQVVVCLLYTSDAADDLA